MNEEAVKKREEAYNDYLYKFMSGYFATKRDEDGMQDWVKLMNLGCFGKEFHIYALAYEDERGRAYRASGKAENLFNFAKMSAVYDYYPTPVIANITRRTCPSGCEDTIKSWLKRESAEKLQEMYNPTYFKSLHKISSIAANNSAKPLLSEIKDYLDGRYIASEINIFEGLVLEAVNQKKLTAGEYWDFAEWIKGVRRELANDIQCKTRYERKLSGFAYIDEGECRFFTDAFLQTTYETKQKYEMEGKIVTPIYERHYWLNDMSELKTVKRDFDEHLKACFDESFWQVYGEISALPGVLDTEIYEKEVAKVREQCSDSAYANFTRYGLRWINK